MASLKDNAGVIIPPPLIFVGGLLIGGVIGRFYSFAFLPNGIGYVLGSILAVVGFGVILIAKSKMAKAQTNIEPWKPTTAILTDGIYGISRNPVYVAMVLIYLGVVFLFNSLWMLPPIILVLFVMHFVVILKEEKYLESKFGEEYLNYKKEVRRWI